MKFAVDAIPPGTNNSLAAGIEAIKQSNDRMRSAAEWVEKQILAVRNASSTWLRDADDEEIAGEILREYEKQKSIREQSN